MNLSSFKEFPGGSVKFEANEINGTDNTSAKKKSKKTKMSDNERNTVTRSYVMSADRSGDLIRDESEDNYSDADADADADPNQNVSQPRALPKRGLRRSGLSVIDDIKRQQNNSNKRYLSETNMFYIKFFALPIFVSLLYATAILFPPEARTKAPLLLWTDGALVKDTNENRASFCPRESICSDGTLQIFLIAISRLTAFASYVLMGQTFLSKMHCTIHALSTSYVGSVIPLAKLHNVHKNAGMWYTLLAVVHAISHTIRWAIRGDLQLINTSNGISGVVGVVCIVLVIVSMTSLAKKLKSLTFEMRFNAHWTFLVFLNVALCFHAPRCRVIVLIFR